VARALIELVPIGNVDPDLLDFLALVLPEALPVSCRLRTHPIELEEAYHPLRQQYHSTVLLAQLVRSAHNPAAKVLGVTDVDLFIPIFTFVFGEAQLGGTAALISVHRLDQRFYGLPEDRRLLLERCEKEALHELGHTFGLVHCADFECVMHFSNSIEHVDLKSNAFCASCGRIVRDALARLASAAKGAERRPS
jgi:archaemetzincin